MRIKSYECSRFAGLKDIRIDFNEGLNVVLGSNESGKSTIVDGIYSTLFKDTKIRHSVKSDKDFVFKFFPKPTGDFINGKVKLETDEGTYELIKEWGSSERIELRTPEGTILKNANHIKEELERIFIFGESTYSNIVFAKQREIKQALSNILTNREVTGEVSDMLRMALMELGGISVDSIQDGIESELDKLYKRWDRDKNYPENNRGISNPYKSGLGSIIDSYYMKENLKLLMESAERAEREFEQISGEMKDLEGKAQSIAEEKNGLEKIEDSVNSRRIIGLKIEAVNRDLRELYEANTLWPKAEVMIAGLEKNHNGLKAKKEELLAQQKNLNKAREAEVQRKRLAEIEDIEKRLALTAERLAKIPVITIDDINALSELKTELQSYQAYMKAGKLKGKIKSVTDKSVIITKDLNDPELAKAHSTFEAGSFVRIEYGNEFELEIQAADIDIEDLKNKYETGKQRLADSLSALEIDSIEAGRLILERIQEEKNEEAMLKRELKLVMGTVSIDEIKSKIEESAGINISRSPKEIEKELDTINQEELEILSTVKAKKNEVKQWEEKFENNDKLLDLIVEKKIHKNNLEEDLAKLKPLPEAFATEDEFKKRLTCLKEEFEVDRLALDELKSKYYDAKTNLPEETFEEYEAQYLQAKSNFEKNLKKGEKLHEIRKVFMATKDRMARNPMEPLIDEFRRLLGEITDGRYSTGDIDEDFNLRLKNPNGEIPIELLSAGTYDSVVLALRFSLLKHIFEDRKGYLILDDCLVDLDPARKRQSIAIIKEFAKEYQTIFTTCDPDTARMLSNDVITIKPGF